MQSATVPAQEIGPQLVTTLFFVWGIKWQFGDHNFPQYIRIEWVHTASRIDPHNYCI